MPHRRARDLRKIDRPRRVQPDRRFLRRAMRHPAAVFAAALLAASSLAAAPLQVPDPVAFAHLGVSQQEAASDELHRRMLAATPEERAAFRVALRESIERLTPVQRKEIVDLTRLRWEQMTPAERERVLTKRRQWAAQMTPQERDEAISQRKRLFEALSPDESRRLRERLPAK